MATMTSTTDLVEWLRAQLDGDERQVRGACKQCGVWETEGCGDYPEPCLRGRALREVAAKRAILDLHPHQRFVEPLHAKSFHPDDRRAAFAESPRYVGCQLCDWDYRFEVVTPGWWCDTVRLLAAPYIGQPGYLDEWAPSTGNGPGIPRTATADLGGPPTDSGA